MRNLVFELASTSGRDHDSGLFEIRLGQQHQRFRVWDGKDLHSGSVPSPHEDLPLPEKISAVTRRLLFPTHVTPDYWEYTQWRALQRVFSSMLNVMTTRSLFMALGVGSREALPASAALNWALKEGIGRLGKFGVSAWMGHTFDSDLKKYRFAASLLFTGSSFIELVTPVFPQLFIPLASVSATAKAVSLSFALSVQPAIHRSFLGPGQPNNLAEITAKAQAQHVVSDNVGLALTVLLIRALERAGLVTRVPGVRRWLGPMVVYPTIAALELFCSYRELKGVHLRNFNRTRGELVAEMWAARGSAPSFAEVSECEPLFLPGSVAVSGGFLPLRILGPLDLLNESGASPAEITREGRAAKYLIQLCRGGPPAPLVPGGPSLGVCLREDAAVSDALEALLHAAYVRKEARAAPVVEWPKVLSRTRVQARVNSKRFMDDLRKAGWDLDLFLFGGQERVRFAAV